MNRFYAWKLQKTEQMELYFKQLSDITLEIEQNLTPEAYLARGLIHTGLANYEQAIADLHQALVQAPTNAIAYFTRGLAYASLKDYPSAVNDYSQVLTLSPDDAIARNNRGVAYAEMGDYQKALKDFVQGLSLNASPIEVGLHVNCGRCREVLGDHDGASNDFQTAMDLPEYYADGGDLAAWQQALQILEATGPLPIKPGPSQGTPPTSTLTEKGWYEPQSSWLSRLRRRLGRTLQTVVMQKLE